MDENNPCKQIMVLVTEAEFADLEKHKDESWIENDLKFGPARIQFSGLFQVSRSHFHALNNCALMQRFPFPL